MKYHVLCTVLPSAYYTQGLVLMSPLPFIGNSWPSRFLRSTLSTLPFLQFFRNTNHVALLFLNVSFFG